MTQAKSNDPFNRQRKDVTPHTPSPLTVQTNEVPTVPKTSIKSHSTLTAPSKEEDTEPIKATTALDGEVSDRPDTHEESDIVKETLGVPEKEEFSKEELLPMLDSLLNHGYALDQFKIRGTTVVLRTRFTWEEQYIFRHLEASQIKTAIMYNIEHQNITLAASLTQFGDYSFNPINAGTEEELDKSMFDRYEFIMSLNSVIRDILQAKLDVFNAKQRYIIENFDKLLADF